MRGPDKLPAGLKDPLTGAVVELSYGPGETYDSVFTSLGSSYEECRAECVGIHLCLQPGVCEIFGHSGAEAEDIKYANWLSMVHAGLKGLEMFSPASGEWKQAHSQARFVIMQVKLVVIIVS
jgi:dipeptidyl-peptidase-3